MLFKIAKDFRVAFASGQPPGPINPTPTLSPVCHFPFLLLPFPTQHSSLLPLLVHMAAIIMF